MSVSPELINYTPYPQLSAVALSAWRDGVFGHFREIRVSADQGSRDRRDGEGQESEGQESEGQESEGQESEGQESEGQESGDQESADGARPEIKIELSAMSVTWRAASASSIQPHARARSLRVTARWRGASASAREVYILALDGQFVERDELVAITDRLTRRALARLYYELSSR